jgi:hypothetical protein
MCQACSIYDENCHTNVACPLMFPLLCRIFICLVGRPWTNFLFGSLIILMKFHKVYTVHTDYFVIHAIIISLCLINLLTYMHYTYSTGIAHILCLAVLTIYSSAR